MKIPKNEDPYFLWLCTQVNIFEADRGWINLLQDLHASPFIWSVPNDDNRSEDGIQLRETYANLYPGYNYSLDGNASVLEMLIALAIQMDGILGDLNGWPKVANWFVELLQNLDLEPYYGFRDADTRRLKNSQKLHVFLGREYDSNGRGGLFPLKHPEQDQRKVEIWYQLMAYLNEH
ncbi:TPA: hypothetical protein DCQ22_04025 [Candidatus Nomurabacteria bacterium]|nr:hypothetical protein [Candidatus Nomurabacteria bacterium]